MKVIIDQLTNHQTLSREEAQTALMLMATGQCNDNQMAAFMTVYMMRAISIAELEGFRDAMLALCNAVDLTGYNAIDVCGTGGDEKNTFNISTTASFVIAGAGVPVAKHGNYGVSSISGSSNVLEHLGVTFSDSPEHMVRSIEQAGICFMHAPLFHPAMKRVAPIRKALGVKTFFNILGPMINPADPPNQMVGVFNLELARLYGYLYQHTNKQFSIVYSLDCYDEISLTSACKIVRNHGESILSPEQIGFETLSQQALHGGSSIAASAEIMLNVLSQKGTKAQTDVVIANAGLALATAQKTTLAEGVAAAQESMQSGRALQAFKRFIAVNSQG